MALLVHRLLHMTIRYTTLASPAMRAAYDDAMGKMRRQFTLTPVGRPILPDKLSLLHSEIVKTLVGQGYCAPPNPLAPAHMPALAKPATTTSPRPNSAAPSPTNSPPSKPSKPTRRTAAAPTKQPAMTASPFPSPTTSNDSTVEAGNPTPG
ncbi:hypothetical protein [Mycobacterium persicum]|uniref:hypothetical protein n=1 Tax=Mycobacterium persicum TaxID=1487726 RepID=UPI0016053521|nr:hypothetical protein [Mycobacterium persicum]